MGQEEQVWELGWAEPAYLEVSCMASGFILWYLDDGLKAVWGPGESAP